MRQYTWIIAFIMVAIVAVGGYFFYSYLSESKHLPKEIEERQEWKVAVADANRQVVLESVACFALLPMFVWFLALFKVFRLSWLRNTMAAAVVVLGVFSIFVLWMDRIVKERDASYLLPPGTVIDALLWATVWTVCTALFWFVIERIYVAKRIAPNA